MNEADPKWKAKESYEFLEKSPSWIQMLDGEVS
jgi:hypothetical protein